MNWTFSETKQRIHSISKMYVYNVALQHGLKMVSCDLCDQTETCKTSCIMGFDTEFVIKIKKQTNNDLKLMLLSLLSDLM